MFRQMKAISAEKIDMAVVNNHAFRKSLPEGPITVSDVYETLQIDGRDWDPDRVYTVVTIDYLAQGSGGMTAFRKATHTNYTKLYLRDLILKEMEDCSRAGRLLRAHIDDRFTILP